MRVGSCEVCCVCFQAVCHTLIAHLSDPHLQRLAEEPDRPTIIIMHQPPSDSGISFIDAYCCRNGARMAAIVSRYAAVERILCGHVHRFMQLSFGRTMLVLHRAPPLPMPCDCRTMASRCRSWSRLLCCSINGARKPASLPISCDRIVPRAASLYLRSDTRLPEGRDAASC